MSIAESDQPPVNPPSKDPNRKEAIIITGLKPREDNVQMVCLEMIRDAQGDLVEMKPFEPIQEKGVEAQSPLLDAFVEGFRVGSSGKLP